MCWADNSWLWWSQWSGGQQGQWWGHGAHVGVSQCSYSVTIVLYCDVTVLMRYPSAHVRVWVCDHGVLLHPAQWHQWGGDHRLLRVLQLSLHQEEESCPESDLQWWHHRALLWHHGDPARWQWQYWVRGPHHVFTLARKQTLLLAASVASNKKVIPGDLGRMSHEGDKKSFRLTVNMFAQHFDTLLTNCCQFSQLWQHCPWVFSEILRFFIISAFILMRMCYCWMIDYLVNFTRLLDPGKWLVTHPVCATGCELRAGRAHGQCGDQGLDHSWLAGLGGCGHRPHVLLTAAVSTSEHHEHRLRVLILLPQAQVLPRHQPLDRLPVLQRQQQRRPGRWQHLWSGEAELQRMCVRHSPASCEPTEAASRARLGETRESVETVGVFWQTYKL